MRSVSYGVSCKGRDMLSYYAFYAGDHVTKESKERLVHKYKYLPPITASTLQSIAKTAAFTPSTSSTLTPNRCYIRYRPAIPNRKLAICFLNYYKPIDLLPQLVIASNTTLDRRFE